MATRGLGLGLNLGFTRGQLTGVPDWTPDDLDTAPIGWFDADDGDTITLNGSDVSEWANKGTGTAVSQATALYQPAYSSTGFNGKPVIIYDSDTLQSSVDMQVRASFFVTDDLYGSAENGTVCPIFGGSDPTEYTFVQMQNIYTISLDGEGRASWNGGLSLGSGYDIDLGVSYAQKVAPALFYTDYNADVGLTYLGTLDNGTVYLLRGRIAEAVFLTERPTTDIRQKMEGYLAHKWWGAGSANTLPSGHPYKDNPPTV